MMIGTYTDILVHGIAADGNKQYPRTSFSVVISAALSVPEDRHMPSASSNKASYHPLLLIPR